MEKIKVNLNGAQETMLQSFYARASYSRTKHPKDCKKDRKNMAEELLNWVRNVWE